MNVLIDTNILLWFLQGNDSIPGGFVDIIENSNNRVFVSIASLWEISIKMSIGRLEFGKPFIDFFPEELNQNGIEILDISIYTLEKFQQCHLYTEIPLTD